MENKKFLIPIILGSALLLGIVFTLVYKKTSEDPFKEPEIQTLAPKTTETQIETKIQVENGNNIEEFNINETKEPPKSVIVSENNEVLSESEAKEYDESIANSMKVEIETKEDGSQILLDAGGNEIGVVETDKPAQETMSGQVMEEIQEDINDYTYKQSLERIREFIKMEIQSQKEAGNTDFMDITDEYINNATPDELDSLYIKVMQTVGFER